MKEEVFLVLLGVVMLLVLVNKLVEVVLFEGLEVGLAGATLL